MHPVKTLFWGLILLVFLTTLLAIILPDIKKFQDDYNSPLNKTFREKPSDFKSYIRLYRNTYNDVEILEKATKIVKNSPELYNELGIGYSKLASKSEKDFNQKAIDNFIKAISIDKNYFRAYYNLGKLYERTNNLQAAKENYLKSLEIKPDLVESMNKLGVLTFCSENNKEKSLEYLNKAIQKGANGIPEYNKVEFNIWKVKGNEISKAEYHRLFFSGLIGPSRDIEYCKVKSDIIYYPYLRFDKKLLTEYTLPVTDPKSVKDFMKLGKYYEKENFRTKALETYQKVMKLDPNYAKAYYNYALEYTGSNPDPDKYNVAIDYLKKAIALEPDNANYYYKSGIYYSLTKQHKPAFEAFLKAIELNPKLERAQMKVADYYLEQNDLLKAEKHYQEAYANTNDKRLKNYLKEKLIAVHNKEVKGN